MKAGKKYIYITGGKGGIGKSMFALSLVDYMSTKGKVLLIDTDPVNADSIAAYKEGKDPRVQSKRARVRSEDSSGQVDSSGLMETLNDAADTDADIIIVDAPAGDSILIMSSGGKIIIDSCKLIEAESIFVWLVDTADKSAVNTLTGAWEMIKDADKVLIVKNYRKGANFDFFDNSKIYQTVIQASNVRVIDFPKIAEKLQELIRIERMTWSEIITKAAIGYRAEAQRYRKEMHKILEEDAGL